jgi:hypothetical protein
MKLFIVAIAVGAAIGIVASQLEPVRDFIADIFPEDMAKRQALSLCIPADPNFNRLDAAARDRCHSMPLWHRGSLTRRHRRDQRLRRAKSSQKATLEFA